MLQTTAILNLLVQGYEGQWRVTANTYLSRHGSALSQQSFLEGSFPRFLGLPEDAESEASSGWIDIHASRFEFQ